ncbi:MAG: IS1634 family transposase [Actinobacteria bacterium]|nr:IS1634 family transposase [Actinomycetota bacterium]
MASIVGKTFGGQTYYYLREMARVGGKPKMVSERYLGKAADIEAAMAGATVEPERTRHLAFGDLAAVWGMIERLDVAGIVDEVVGPRRGDAAASVGTYIALATANRVVDPCSKLAFGDWWATTAGDRWVRLPAAALDHRRFWDAMDAISDKDLREIERRLTAGVVEVFGIDLSGLVLDMTNFATYIDSANERAPIAQRGHAKQKRTDLRLVGLGLVVSTDGGIPLLSHTYAGDRPDVTQFASMVNELVARWGALAADTDELTLVYDAGQDSVANQALIEATSLHFVGSLPPSDFPALLQVPASRFAPVGDPYPGVTAFEDRVVALGTKRRVVVVHSPTLHAKQVAGFTQTLTKASGRLTELAERLARGKTRRGRAAVEAEIAQVLAPRWLSRVIATTLSGDGPATFELTWSIDAAARRALESEQFGKRILFTDHDEWSHARVIGGYRSQSEVEADFRQMKDTAVVGFSPMFHWTDQKIRVHSFYCVLALSIARLLRRQAAKAGYAMSVRELLATLAGIQETVLLYPSTGGRPRARRMTTERNTTQARLYELFGLDAYAPRKP